MKYIFLILIVIIIITLKPLNLSQVEKLVPKIIKVEVKGHLKNGGIFEVANYSTIGDIIEFLNLYADSDLNHYSLNTRLLDNQILIVKKFEKEARISINADDIDKLVNLKGIGETIALRIVEYREINGGFKKLEDIMNVKGIGEKIFLNIKDFITL